MHKYLIFLLSLFTLSSLNCHAGGVEFYCSNEESTLTLTEEALVIALPGVDFREHANMFSETPSRGVRIDLLSSAPHAQQVGYLQINTVSDKKTLADQKMANCESGVGARLLIETFLVEGRLHVNALDPQNVRLNCMQQTYWSGTCD